MLILQWSPRSAPESVTMTRILIVDDHHHYRAQLRHLIAAEADWQICGEAADGQEAIEKHSSIHPHNHGDGFQYASAEWVGRIARDIEKMPRRSDLVADDIRVVTTDCSGQEARNQRLLF